MTESRMELLNWLNATLDLNYTKVEQLGTGAAYCQIMDSIFLDVAMHKVKFDATKEYESINNYKVLQACFVKHKINKTIPVERLVKCKFQDNLEFFQWIRKFWKENKDEADYDPNARRKFVPPTPSGPGSSTGSAPVRSRPGTVKPLASSTTPGARRSTSSSSSTSTNTSTNNGLPRSRTTSGTGPASRAGSRVTSMNNTLNRELEQELLQTRDALTQADTELEEYRTAVEALETERNFYFNKLREIEILTETTSDLIKEPPQDGEEHPSLKDILIKIQEVLYSTEEGFQVPEENMEENGVVVPEIDMEEETF